MHNVVVFDQAAAEAGKRSENIVQHRQLSLANHNKLSPIIKYTIFLARFPCQSFMR